MASGRMITSDTWEDDFITSLSVFERLVWIGLITGCADDQGRLQDSASLIRSKIFPVDDIPIKDIEKALNSFDLARKIERYIAGTKKLIQIINWWKHQKPRWAGKSNYPPPAGWIDRVRYHSAGNEIIELNWKSCGGYIPGYIAPNTIREDEGEDEVKGEDEGNIVGSLIPLSKACMQFMKVQEFNGGVEQWNKGLMIMQEKGITPEIIEKAVYRLSTSGKDYTLLGPQSILNTCFNIQRERGARNNHKPDDNPLNLEPAPQFD